MTTHSDKSKGYKGFELWIDGAIVGQMLMDQPPTREPLTRTQTCNITLAVTCLFSAADTAMDQHRTHPTSP